MYKDKDRQREYQRNWVRQKRAKGSTEVQGSTVIPKCSSVVPDGSTTIDIVDVLHARILARHKIMSSGAMAVPDKPKPKPQSHSPMMVGYVPPEGGA